MTADEERWAEAAAILKWQGDNVRLYLAERLAALGAERNEEGTKRFKDIAERVDALLSGSVN